MPKERPKSPVPKIHSISGLGAAAMLKGFSDAPSCLRSLSVFMITDWVCCWAAVFYHGIWPFIRPLPWQPTWVWGVYMIMTAVLNTCYQVCRTAPACIFCYEFVSVSDGEIDTTAFWTVQSSTWGQPSVLSGWNINLCLTSGLNISSLLRITNCFKGDVDFCQYLTFTFDRKINK